MRGKTSGSPGLLLPQSLIVLGVLSRDDSFGRWSLKSSLLLKCEKHISSDLSSWAVMFWRKKNNAVLRLSLNIFRGCGGECCASIHSFSPSYLLGSLPFVILPRIYWFAQSFFFFLIHTGVKCEGAKPYRLVSVVAFRRVTHG
jgi:hypothetical protein